MFKVFVLAFFILSSEIVFLKYFDKSLLFYINNSKVNAIAYNKSQRRVFNVIRNINQNNMDSTKSVYIFGASSTREFFDLEENLNKDVESNLYKKVYISATSSQSLVDSLRLIDNINTPNSLVILGISPKKFWSEDPSYLELSYLTYGKYLKYPVISNSIKELYEEYSFNDYFNLRLLPPASNTFLYLIKDYVLEQLQNIKRHGLFAYKMYDITVSEQHVKGYTKQLSDDELMQLENKFEAQHMQNTEKNLEFNLNVLRKIIDISRKKELKIVLFDIPLNPLIDELYHNQYQEYIARIDNIKNIKHVRYKEKSKSNHFHDTSHLNAIGKEENREYMINGLHYAMDF